MPPMSAVTWLAKCCLGAVTLLLACGLATAWFGNGLQLPSTTTRDGTLITLNRYAREPIPDVVLVGSSLTFRLKEEYFATPRLRNLALAGGSPVTGLEIVANQPRLPRLVLVEANVLSRPADTALVEKYSKGGNAEPLFFRPIRTAMAAYENWLHAPVSHTQVSLALGRLLEQPPSDFDNRVYADRALQQSDAEDPTVAVQANVTRIEQLIAALERRGARVLLYSFPIPSSSKDRDRQKLLARSSTANSPIESDGCASILREASCVGRMAFIWTNDPRQSWRNRWIELFPRFSGQREGRF